ncbi:hypothetical protein LEP1GSC008_1078 [Leptospira kirschneri serovar Bulgarica str. Nikolaevo]|uniref:Uncharacterized protein n=1 Tax=Leptospira kirschneri serovar Bulgarica str. Nikolaevo TaxID=1240687 RepID=M6FRX8_9LEPT|nr:hypothetical protein LEP1GSC008_1078 [Leptospira kirschneri serovar Bulgarica str. Nikolaevo]
MLLLSGISSNTEKSPKAFLQSGALVEKTKILGEIELPGIPFVSNLYKKGADSESFFWESSENAIHNL